MHFKSRSRPAGIAQSMLLLTLCCLLLQSCAPEDQKVECTDKEDLTSTEAVGVVPTGEILSQTFVLNGRKGVKLSLRSITAFLSTENLSSYTLELRAYECCLTSSGALLARTFVDVALWNPEPESAVFSFSSAPELKVGQQYRIIITPFPRLDFSFHHAKKSLFASGYVEVSKTPGPGAPQVWDADPTLGGSVSMKFHYGECTEEKEDTEDES